MGKIDELVKSYESGVFITPNSTFHKDEIRKVQSERIGDATAAEEMPKDYMDAMRVLDIVDAYCKVSVA